MERLLQGHEATDKKAALRWEVKDQDSPEQIRKQKDGQRSIGE